MSLRREEGVALILATAAVAAAGFAAWGVIAWDKARIKNAYQAGYDKAMEEVKTAQLGADNRALLTQREQIINLSNELTEARNAYDKTQADLATARDAARRAGQRVHNAAAPGGGLEDRLGAAECSVARSFGAGAFRTAVACRGHIEELGYGVGGLVESSSSARFEHRRAEALKRYVSPTASLHTPVSTK
jgi:hypothetical protein